MTQNELFMYDILGRISSTDAPIVFKGGLITKLILAEKQFTSIDRATVDRDAQRLFANYLTLFAIVFILTNLPLSGRMRKII